MNTICWVARTELRALFCTPIAWIIVALFAAQTGFVFSEALGGIVRSQELRYPVGYLTAELFTGRSGVFPSVLKYTYLYIPLLTMGLMSREYSSGSIKLLYASPVKPVHIIWGKYLAVLVLAGVLLAVLVLQVGFAYWRVEALDLPLLAAGLLGIFLLIAVYAAIGLFMSCLTAYQMVAAIGTLAVLALLNFVNQLGQGTDFIRDLTYWLSLTGRAEHFIRGVVLSNDIGYFLLLVALFLTWSMYKLQTDRKRQRIGVVLATYTAVVVGAVLLGYTSSRPSLIVFHDATREKSNTLSAASLEIMRHIPGALHITTYTNLLDADYNVALPEGRNRDLARFDAYRYAKPEIHMDYVYYYLPTTNPSLDRRYPDLSAQDRARELAKVHALDFDRFLPPDSLKDNADLAHEDFRFLRVVEHMPTGKKAYLRLFDDATRHPSESEISIALKRMAVPMPEVGFLTGFGERDSKRSGDRHYQRFAREKGFRFSLVNQGFDATDVTLAQSVPDAITILVIADIRRALSADESKYLHDYIARGGNLLIAGEPDAGASYLNGTLALFGITLGAEALSQPNDDYSVDLIQANPTPALIGLSHYFEVMDASPRVVTMPGAAAISYADTVGGIIPILEAVPGTALHGDSSRLYTTGVALEREYGDRKQKVVVLADADCFSNTEISMRRKGVRAANFSLVTGLFNWLSDGLAPLDTRRAPPLDIHMALSPSGLVIWGRFFQVLLPLAIGLVGTALLLYRRRR